MCWKIRRFATFNLDFIVTKQSAELSWCLWWHKLALLMLPLSPNAWGSSVGPYYWRTFLPMSIPYECLTSALGLLRGKRTRYFQWSWRKTGPEVTSLNLDKRTGSGMSTSTCIGCKPLNLIFCQICRYRPNIHWAMHSCYVLCKNWIIILNGSNG